MLFEQAEVEKVIDGDTIKVKINGKSQNIRIEGLFAPELEHKSLGIPAEAGGEEARKGLEKILLGKKVDILVSERSYNRLVGLVYLEGKDIRNIILEQDDLNKYYNEINADIGPVAWEGFDSGIPTIQYDSPGITPEERKKLRTVNTPAHLTYRQQVSNRGKTGGDYRRSDLSRGYGFEGKKGGVEAGLQTALKVKKELLTQLEEILNTTIETGKTLNIEIPELRGGVILKSKAIITEVETLIGQLKKSIESSENIIEGLVENISSTVGTTLTYGKILKLKPDEIRALIQNLAKEQQEEVKKGIRSLKSRRDVTVKKVTQLGQLSHLIVDLKEKLNELAENTESINRYNLELGNLKPQKGRT